MKKLTGFLFLFVSLALLIFFQNCGKDLNSQFQGADQSSFSADMAKPEFNLDKPITIGFQSFAVDMTKPSSLFAVDAIDTVYFSSDSGASWKKMCKIDNLKNNSTINFKIVPGKAEAYLFVNGQLFRVEDMNALGCRQIEPNEYYYYGSNFFDVNSKGDLFVWGSKGLRVSSDKGASFTKLIDAPAFYVTLAVNPKNEASVISFHYGNSKDYFPSGFYFGDRRIDIDTSMIGSLNYTSPLSVHPQNSSIIFLGNTFSMDGGQTWKSNPNSYSNMDKNGTVYNLNYDSQTQKYFIYSSADILESTPHWKKESGNGLVDLKPGTYQLIGSSNFRYILLNRKLYVSSDNGENYASVGYSTAHVPMMASSLQCSGKVCYASSPMGYIFKSVDKTQSWSVFKDLTTQSQFSQGTSLLVHPNLSDRLAILPLSSNSYLSSISNLMYFETADKLINNSTINLYDYPAYAFDLVDNDSFFILGRNKLIYKSAAQADYTELSFQKTLLGGYGVYQLAYHKNTEGRSLFYLYNNGLYKLIIETSENKNITANLPFADPAGLAQTRLESGKVITMVISSYGNLAQSEDGLTYVLRSSAGALSYSSDRKLLIWPGQTEILLSFSKGQHSFSYSANAGVNWTNVAVDQNCYIQEAAWIEKRYVMFACGASQPVARIRF